MRRKKKKGGMEWKILTDPKIADRAVEAAERGVPVRSACVYAGMDPQTYYNYLDIYDNLQDELQQNPKRQLEKHEKAIIDMVERLKIAENVFEAKAVKKIAEVGFGEALIREETLTDEDGTIRELKEYLPPNWQALMTILERKFPERWARFNRLDIKEERTVKGEISILSGLSADELKTLIELFEAFGKEAVLGELRRAVDIEREQKALLPGDRKN